ncbi:virulence factor Mce family protein [Aeromicrobium marinum DSM 15272]|uniref:Virulence factor Mce family protein n=1 Tax=Aeromicrobium marinum DSM 15272 TaxID=585531 RepID=E2S872_9ACTN|nr:MlaD family protein [Aeromicrobium marinum]EFQ84377.1 virulence factor Mce family protein [Aeromicrobium marinum DSM 15272]
MTALMNALGIKQGTRGDLAKLVVFLVVAGFLTSYLYVITANDRSGDARPFRAEFENISGLEVGSDVRIASVVVGKVSEIDVGADAMVTVTFDLNRRVELTDQSTAVVRYKNLIGDRYLQLGEGQPGGQALTTGATIGANRTSAALDLDTLLNGFKPLFVGLNPQQVNQLSEDLILVLQGQSAEISSLLATVGSLTSTLGERDELVGQVIQNLDTALASIGGEDDALEGVIVQLSRFTDGLDDDATAVLDAAGQINSLSADAAALLAEARPDFTGVLSNLRGVTTTLNENRDFLDTTLETLPGHYQQVNRTGSYGDFFNFFLCGIRVRLTPENDPSAAIVTPYFNSGVERCEP